MKKQKAQFPSSEDTFWEKYHQDTKAKEGERLEDAAKFLSGMISISLSIFLKINDDAFAALSSSWYAVLVVVLWLAALAGSFFVFFPFQYPVKAQVPTTIEAFHDTMVRRKRRLLLMSTVCFFLALLLLGMSFIGETL
jgi:hypothetical protein